MGEKVPDPVNAAWNKAVKGEHFDKIKPLQ